jgi:hypothetical protein
LPLRPHHHHQVLHQRGCNVRAQAPVRACYYQRLTQRWKMPRVCRRGFGQVVVVFWARVFEIVRGKSSSKWERGVWRGEYFWNLTLDLIFDSLSASAICILLHSCIALSTFFTATRRSLTDSLGSSVACTPQPHADRHPEPSQPTEGVTRRPLPCAAATQQASQNKSCHTQTTRQVTLRGKSP